MACPLQKLVGGVWVHNMPKDAGPLCGASHVGNWALFGASGWHDLLSMSSSEPWLRLIVWSWI